MKIAINNKKICMHSESREITIVAASFDLVEGIHMGFDSKYVCFFHEI